MPIALRPGTTRSYVLERERGGQSPTTFHLRTLTLQEEYDCLAMLDEVGVSESLRMRKMIDHVVSVGLVKWDGWMYDDGQPVEVAPAEAASLLSGDDRAELAIAIRRTEPAQVEKSGS